MITVALILLAVCLIVLGATAPKPVGWAVLTLALIALLLVVLGGLDVRIGR